MEQLQASTDQKDPLSWRVIGCAMEVHNQLGPGLLESTYEKCLSRELSHAGIEHQCQVPVGVSYKGINLNCGYRADIIVGKRILIELKSAREITSIHQAQLMTYLKLAQLRVGLIINFNVQYLKYGIKRIVL